jgi:hypothetical protein
MLVAKLKFVRLPAGWTNPQNVHNVTLSGRLCQRQSAKKTQEFGPLAIPFSHQNDKPQTNP